MLFQWPRARWSLHRYICFLLWLVLLLKRTSICQTPPPVSHYCNEFCGSIAVPYPFGISRSCGLQQFNLSCAKNQTLMLTLGPHSYQVLNFTAHSIIIGPLTSSCSRPNFDLFGIEGSQQYAISKNNYLVMYSCTNLENCPGNCSFPKFTFPEFACNLSAECCYDLFLSRRPDPLNISSVGCSSFASWTTDFFPPASQPELTVYVQYGLELNWAIPGDCSTTVCQKNATCTNSDAISGYNCACDKGFVGNGYQNSSGCHTVSCDSETVIGCVCPDGTRMGEGGCQSQDSTRRVILVACIIAGGTILAGAIIAVALARRHHRVVAGRRSNMDMKQLSLLLCGNDRANKVTLFSYKDLEKATKGFSASEILGHGAHGTVYAGKLPDGQLVAVKRINNVGRHGVELVLNEIMVLSTVRHRNLILLYGCCLELQDPLLVYEFVPNGTLAEHLLQERGKALDWLTRITIATEAAQALAYLHSEVNPPIYHRDVKSSNILLDFKYNTKVADFGLSKLVLTEGSHISTVPQGTPGYLDPEYHQNFHLSDKSDVYSFGVVLIEIITAMKVVDFSREQREVNLAALALSKISSGTLQEIVDPTLDANSNPLIMSLVQRVAELAFRCLSYDKDARPTMMEVVDELEQIRLGSLVLEAQSSVQNMTAFGLHEERTILPR